MRRARCGGHTATVAVVALAAAAAVGCGTHEGADGTATRLVPDAALSGLLLGAGEIQSVMGGALLIAQPVSSGMDDNRNLLPNLNCLGVWHAGESAIYGTPAAAGGWSSVRRQLLRPPGAEQWSWSVVQSVISYPTAEGARDFFTQSTDRWSKCTNHTVNITLNDQRLPRWLSGRLDTRPDRLTMPISRTDGLERSSCQHVVSLESNLIIDVEACVPRAANVTQAGEIAARIASHIPTAG